MSLLTFPWPQLLDANGDTYPGAKLYFYDTGTSTLATVYSNGARTTAHANPVVADANGVFAPIYLADKQYKVVLKTSADVTLFSADPVASESYGYVDDYAALRAIPVPVNGQQAYVTDAGIAGLFVFDSSEAGTDDGGTIIDPTDATVGAWVRRYDGGINVKWFGAVGDGSTDDTAALQAAVDAAVATGGTVTCPAGETYIVTTTLDMTGLRFADLGQSVIKQGASAELETVVSCVTGVSSGVFNINLNVNANATNNTAAVTGVLFENTQSANFQASVDVVDADIGVDITGNQEVGSYALRVYNCATGVYARINDTSGLSPDELSVAISGRNCDCFLKVDNTTGRFVMNCETGEDASGYAVDIIEGRSTILTGLMRGIAGGGIKVQAGTLFLDNMHLASLGTASGTNYALYVHDCTAVEGQLSVVTSLENLAYIRAAETGRINLYLSGKTISGSGITLGEASVSQLVQANIRAMLHTVTGNALIVNNAAYCNIKFDSLTTVGNLNFAAGNLENTVTVPARAYATGITLTHNSNMQLIFDGILSSTERDAISAPFEGMMVRANRTTNFKPNYYIGSAWTVTDAT